LSAEVEGATLLEQDRQHTQHCIDMNNKEFSITNRHGDVIRGNIHAAAVSENAPLLIICHGFKGFKDWGMFPYAAETLASRGISVLRFNFSLNGIADDPLNFTALERFERNTATRELEDLDDVINAVESGVLTVDRADPTKLAVLGHSLGGGICIVKAAEDARIRAAVTWAGVSNFDRWGPKIKKQWRELGRMEILNARTNQLMPMDVSMLNDLEANSERLDIVAAAGRIRCPLLILHGDQDVSVPLEEGLRMYHAATTDGKTMHVIPNTDHTFGAVHPFAGSTPALDSVLDLTAAWLLKEADKW
jgi:uncharacterized protein